MRIDLHCHSTASDGTMSPQELVELAESVDIQQLALTDHDCVDGISSAMQVSKVSDLRIIPGVEISVSWQGITVHILGLNIDWKNAELCRGLESIQQFRIVRAEGIAEGLEQAGIEGALEGATVLAGSSLLSRTHFAQFLINEGKARKMQDVFKRYMVKGKPGYVPGEWVSLETALKWIHNAGGLASIAHPARYKLSAGKLRQLIEEFMSFGGQGLEIVSGSHTDKQNHGMASYARRYNLYGSIGSDFHGEHHPWRKMGLTAAVPDGVFPVWESPQWQHVYS
ncbi:FIG00031715: Predicted metal-dependent phosphoesterases (PHP family) [hydrothermal vent metagenome]|uniref:FIG00031715: Predicted metal-dependent phosphoesterases (PHP family) n=1 Tax=hydrothermal vent metagenome TaxID=652676 RepID=A0A3B0YHS9_9ZZZZ